MLTISGSEIRAAATVKQFGDGRFTDVTKEDTKIVGTTVEVV